VALLALVNVIRLSTVLLRAKSNNKLGLMLLRLDA